MLTLQDAPSMLGALNEPNMHGCNGHALPLGTVQQVTFKASCTDIGTTCPHQHPARSITMLKHQGKCNMQCHNSLLSCYYRCIYSKPTQTN